MFLHFKIFKSSLFIFYLIGVFNCSNAQVNQDSVSAFNKENQMVFAKRAGGWLIYRYKVNYYGRFFGCGNDSYFYDMRSGVRQNAYYLRCGYRYRKFEKYCMHQKIYVNPIELKLIKRAETTYHLMSLGLFLGTFAYSFDYAMYNYSTGPNKFPQNIVGPKSAKFLLPLLVSDLLLSFHIRSKAEKRFMKRWNFEG